jgi:hypothetical protein
MIERAGKPAGAAGGRLPGASRAKESRLTALARAQEEFQALMLGRASDIESHVVGTERVSIATRLGIYSDGYSLRLIDALQANYPALAQLLGEEDFAALGRAYVRANESRFTSIRYYGDGLPEFLANQPEYAAAPVLAELARWEWSMTEVFDAADAEPLDIAALAQIEPHRWAELRFAFHPSVRRLALHWNVPQIWKSITDVAERPRDERPQASVQREATPWVMWRQVLTTRYRSLDVAEASALDAARDDATFGEICVVLSQHLGAEETPAHAAALLKHWIESGLITAIR